MSKFLRLLATRHQLISTCLDLSARPRIGCSTSDNVCLLYAVQVRWKSAASKHIIATAYTKFVDNETPSRALETGDTVELKDGDFLRITDVPLGKYIIRGWRFRFTNMISGLPENLPNEVCWISHFKDGKPQRPEQQGVEEVSISDFVRKRRLILTNKNYPALSGEVKSSNPGTEPVRDQSALICRWKYVCCVKSTRKERRSANVQFYSSDNEWSAITRLKDDECVEGARYRTGDETLRDEWRRHNRIGGDHPGPNNEKLSSLTKGLSGLSINEPNLGHDEQRQSSSEDKLVIQQKHENTYTFGDAFCGAGGASHGAAMAGLQVQWGFDSSLNAYKTYKSNFPHAALLLSAKEFVTEQGRDSKVDILHLSPPCQAFSQANTTPNASKDKINIAASMMIGRILLKARPRIVTLEQTPGIMQYKKNQTHFDEVIRQFTRFGFNIRWKIMKFAEYGLPQERERLIIIASRYVAHFDTIILA